MSSPRVDDFVPMAAGIDRSRLSGPPHEFARAAARLAPDVEIRVLAPGEGVDL
jgi:hypothetical protein